MIAQLVAPTAGLICEDTIAFPNTARSTTIDDNDTTTHWQIIQYRLQSMQMMPMRSMGVKTGLCLPH